MKKLVSLIALAGVFAACQPEEIVTTFEELNAVASVTATAFDVASGADVTANSTFSISTSAAQNANVFVISGNPTLKKQDVTVTANWMNDKGETFIGTQTITINDLLAGGVATYNVKIPVGAYQPDPETTYTISDDYTVIEESYKTFYLENSHHEAVKDPDGKVWYKNPSEFIHTGIVEFTVAEGGETVSYTATSDKYDSAVKGIYDAFKLTYDGFYEEDLTLPIKVSAFAMYCVSQTAGSALVDYDVIAESNGKKEKAGTIRLHMTIYNEAEYEEKACEGHAAHYVPGHGQDGHGAYDNAGGGIAYGD